MIMECDVCNKKFNSKSYILFHKREKHTFVNCEKIICELCETEFNRPITNKGRPEKNLKKCEECRDIQLKFKTNNLKNGTICYDNENNRIKMNKNITILMCKIYDCDNQHPCDIHLSSKKCSNKKCNYFDFTNDSMCRGLNGLVKDVNSLGADNLFIQAQINVARKLYIDPSQNKAKYHLLHPRGSYMICI